MQLKSLRGKCTFCHLHVVSVCVILWQWILTKQLQWKTFYLVNLFFITLERLYLFCLCLSVGLMAGCLSLVYVLLLSCPLVHSDIFTSIGEQLLFLITQPNSICKCEGREISGALHTDAWSFLHSLHIHPLFMSLFVMPGHMSDLLLVERDLVTSLKDYIRAEEDKLEKIKQ